MGGAQSRRFIGESASTAHRVLDELLKRGWMAAVDGAAYCRRHWHLSDTGYGRCPHQHGKSLDPSWSDG
jgi:hypothetical protein